METHPCTNTLLLLMLRSPLLPPTQPLLLSLLLLPRGQLLPCVFAHLLLLPRSSALRRPLRLQCTRQLIQLGPQSRVQAPRC